MTSDLDVARGRAREVASGAVASPRSQVIVGPPGLGKTYATRKAAIGMSDLGFVSTFPTRKRAREGVREWVELGALPQEVSLSLGRDPDPGSPAHCSRYEALDHFRKGGGKALAFCQSICSQKKGCAFLELVKAPPSRLVVTTTANLQVRFADLAGLPDAEESSKRDLPSWCRAPRKLLIDEDLLPAILSTSRPILRDELRAYTAMLSSRREKDARWAVGLRTALLEAQRVLENPGGVVPEMIKEFLCERFAHALLAAAERELEEREGWLEGRKEDGDGRTRLMDPILLAAGTRHLYQEDVRALESEKSLSGLEETLDHLLRSELLNGNEEEGGFLRFEWNRKRQGPEDLSFSPWLLSVAQDVLSSSDGSRVLLRLTRDPGGKHAFEHATVHQEIVEAIRAGRVVNTCTTPLPPTVIEHLNAEVQTVALTPSNVHIENVVGIKPTSGAPLQLTTFARFLAHRAEQVRDGRMLAVIAKKKDAALIGRVLKLHGIPIGKDGWIQIGCYGKDHASTNRYSGVQELHVGWFMIPPEEAYWQARIWEVVLGLPIESVSPEERRRLRARDGLAEEPVTKGDPLFLPFGDTGYTRRWASSDPSLVRECMMHAFAEFAWNATGRGRGIQDPEHEYRVFVWCDIPFPENWMEIRRVTDYRDLLLRYRIRLNVNDVREACVAEVNSGRARDREQELRLWELRQLGFRSEDVAVLAGVTPRWVQMAIDRVEREGKARKGDRDAEPRMIPGLVGGTVAIGETIPALYRDSYKGRIVSRNATLPPLPKDFGAILSGLLTRIFTDHDLDPSARPLSLRVAFASIVAGVVSPTAEVEISRACQESLGWTDLSPSVLQEQLHHRWYAAFARELSIALRGPALLEAALALAEAIAKVSQSMRGDSRERFYDVIASLVRLGAAPQEPRVSRRVLDDLLASECAWASGKHALRTVQRWITHDATLEWWRRWRETLLLGEGPTEPHTKEDSQCA